METSGTTSGPPDWAQFYQQNLSGQNLNTQTTTFGDRVTNAMVGTITPTSACAPSPFSQGGDTSHSPDNLNPQGRVSKPSRRRSRASRRTPTTLVNTDAANFRAMVQQFTGGSVAPYAAVPQYPRESNINFGFGINQQTLNSTAAHVQQQQQQRQVHQQQQVRQQQYMFNSMDNNHGAFLERSYDS